MHPYRRIPRWLLVPLVIITVVVWLIMISWLVLKLLGVENIGANPLEGIPQLINAILNPQSLIK